MNFTGFTNDDFNVFTIDGLEPRMEALIETIRPKLEALGNYFAPALSTMTGDEMFPHVAKHARRTINPPKDTWVAFANNKRGYKKHPHFQIGLWGTHVFVWFAIIYEAPDKVAIGEKFARNLNKIYKEIPNYFVWSSDHMKPDSASMKEMSKKDLQALFQRVQDVKKAELLCGIRIPKEQAIQMDADDFLQAVQDAFVHLVPLYRLA
ncbi:YktB family protein [Falsibacillus pallidus]|uniref:YktB family protein n=1 Tax=Falsibacillus pallidus TaxID=493781 RepID=UPI003D98844B